MVERAPITDVAAEVGLAADEIDQYGRYKAKALKRLGTNAILCMREPSLGPVFGVKGGAAGGEWCGARGAIGDHSGKRGDGDSRTGQ